MSTYLIDFENVKSGGLAGIDHIRKKDSVHLFWSSRENKISIEMMELIRSSESEIVMHKAVTGERDALDHQLCSYLGFLAGGKGETDFIIVSNDKAYDHLIEFWKNMNNDVRIRRVSEIACATEVLAANAEVLLSAAPEEMAVQTDKAESASLETVHASSDAYASRNSRRRERGSKYLKGGKAGRIARKNTYAEEYQEEERTADRVRETESGRTADKVAETAADKAAETAAGRTVSLAKPAEPRRESAAAYVVTGIKTGIIVETGFTADGILDNRSNSEENGKQNGINTEKSVVAEEIAGQQKKPGDETTVENPLHSPVSEKTADVQQEETAKAKYADNQPDRTVQEKTVIKPAEESEKEIAAETQPEEPVKENVSDKRTAEPVNKKTADIQIEKTEKETTADKQTDEPVDDKADDNKTEQSADEKEPADEKGAEVQGKAEADKKQRTRPARTSGRVKRGRPPKKERVEHLPEIKLPIIKADVVAKCEEAADAEWTEEVVRLINESKDKKELYSAIVRLLGQEKGRTVYHEIKILK